MNITQIAIACHQANKAICEAAGDFTQKDWADAEQWQRDSAIKGVQFAIDNPNAPPSAQHDAWCADKIKDGWKFGPEKNATTKEHPCLVDFGMLPVHQRIKDHVFKAIVKSMACL